MARGWLRWRPRRACFSSGAISRSAQATCIITSSSARRAATLTASGHLLIVRNNAGTRLGALAAGAAAGRERLRKTLVAGLSENDLIPQVRDLPEFMPQADFVRRFGGVGQPRYQAMVDRIEQRIAALPLYR